ncbi:hypothetical protein [Bosea sp. 685]|nr:hypothetical protein [Bosea sp. 685]WNJ93277.1 hypothetical protein RMR04_13710 [Bosea sp. 685]
MQLNFSFAGRRHVSVASILIALTSVIVGSAAAAAALLPLSWLPLS